MSDTEQDLSDQEKAAALEDLVSGVLRDEAQVKAEALREAADAQDADPGFRDPLRLKSAWLRDRAREIGEAK